MSLYFRFLIGKSRCANRGRTHQTNRALRLVAMAALALGAWTVHAEDTPRSAMHKGLKAYQAGDYTNAVALLEKSVLEFPAVGYYNLGNACYRLGQFEEAQEHYSEALRSPDLHLQAQAYYNLGNALLARTTTMTDNEEIGLAIECAFQAVDMYEKALLLEPDDQAAKQNYERAWSLRLKLEFNQGKWLFDEAEALLEQYKAKDAQTSYRKAKKQFKHILENVDADHAETMHYLSDTEERLALLDQAVASAESDLATALQFISDYQYIPAAQRLTTETDERKYAFDLKPDLKKKYEETIQKNQEVLKIIQDLFPTTNMAK
jgi:tetratricopeptide (TPR) repeat protein